MHYFYISQATKQSIIIVRENSFMLTITNVCKKRLPFYGLTSDQRLPEIARFLGVYFEMLLFGTKKAASVDSSATGALIAHIGANVLTKSAAPFTYEPPAFAIPDCNR